MIGYNSMEEEIQNRITLGNEAYNTSKFIFNSRLISSKLKMKFCWNIKRPIVIYAYETWRLKETIQNKLMVFETKVLRKIFGNTEEAESKEMVN